MAHRDFAAARAEVKAAPITFTLGGQDYAARRRMPAGYLLDLSAVEDDLPALSAFLHAALLDDDGKDGSDSAARFTAALHDPHALGKDQPIEVELLADIVGWLIEEQTGRPTKPPAGSPRGRSSSGRSSKASARSRSR